MIQINSKKQAVVTGGAGFIGSHITDELVKQGWRVKIIDDLSTGNIENLKHLIDNNKIEFIKGSISDLDLLKDIFSHVDCIFHQAAYVSVHGSIQTPLLSHEINVTGTLNVLIAAREVNVKRVIFASSSAVYGDSVETAKKEDSILKPQSPYAVNKLAGEYYSQIFNEIYKIPTVCLRYFNVYGPRQKPESEYAAIIPKIFHRVKAGKPPIIYGDGEQTRDFIFVKDIVNANLLMLENSFTGVFNVGTGESCSLNRLCQIILKYMNREDIKPIYENKRPGDIKDSLADINKIRKLSFAPKYKIEEGLKELANEIMAENI